MSDLPVLSPLYHLAQKAAEFYWAVATSDEITVAVYTSDAYRHAEAALMAVLRVTYPDVPEQVLRAARDELADLGPSDGDYRVQGTGIDSYVRAQLEEHEREQHYAAHEAGSATLTERDDCELCHPRLASCGHVADEDGECGCACWPERCIHIAQGQAYS